MKANDLEQQENDGGALWPAFLGAAAGFYVGFGGLLLSDYLPCLEYQRAIANGVPPSALNNPETFGSATDYPFNLAEAHFYGAILIWGTAALMAFALGLFVARRFALVRRPTSK